MVIRFALAATLSVCVLPAPASADALAAFARARAAEGDKAVDTAARQYALALAGDAGDPAIAFKAWRGAMLAGDFDLAHRAMAQITASGRLLPADAWLLTLAEAVHAGDAHAAGVAVAALDAGTFRFLTPLVRAWIAFDAHGDAMRPLSGEVSSGSRRLFDENRALLMIATGKTDAGAADLQTLLRESAGGLDLRYAGAELLAGQNRPETAKALLRGDDPAVAYFRDHFRPAQPSAAFGLSRLFSRIAADLDDPRVAGVAISYARTALVLDPRNDRARVLLGESLARIGAYRAAFATLDAVDADGPFRLMAQNARIKALDASGDQARALAAARALSEAPGADDNAARLYGNLLMEADRPADAASAFTVARDRMGAQADWRAWLQIGAAEEEAGRWDLARPALERAVAMAPDQPLALNYLGYSLADRGEDLDRAQGLLEKAYAMVPGEPSIMDSLAWVYFRRGENGKALPLLEVAARGAPANGDIFDHLGDAYWTAGRYIDARHAWRAALALVDDTSDRRQLDSKLLNGPAQHP